MSLVINNFKLITNSIVVDGYITKSNGSSEMIGDDNSKIREDIDDKNDNKKY